MKRRIRVDLIMLALLVIALVAGIALAAPRAEEGPPWTPPAVASPIPTRTAPPPWWAPLMTPAATPSRGGK